MNTVLPLYEPKSSQIARQIIYAFHHCDIMSQIDWSNKDSGSFITPGNSQSLRYALKKRMLYVGMLHAEAEDGQYWWILYVTYMLNIRDWLEAVDIQVENTHTPYDVKFVMLQNDTYDHWFDIPSTYNLNMSRSYWFNTKCKFLAATITRLHLYRLAWHLTLEIWSHFAES